MGDALMARWIINIGLWIQSIAVGGVAFDDYITKGDFMTGALLFLAAINLILWGWQSKSDWEYGR